MSSVKKSRKTFFFLSRAWDKGKILSPHELKRVLDNNDSFASFLPPVCVFFTSWPSAKNANYTHFLFSLCTASKVCYGKYGCFSSDPPFDKSLILLPSNPDSIGTKFILHTKTNAQSNLEILNTDNNTSIVNSTFDPLLKVKFIVHGYTQNGESAWVKKMASELLKKEKMNVIVVDWGLGSSVMNLYDIAAGNTRLVGAQVADLIDVLHRKFNVALNKFHIIGHSLGAQVAGFAGERLVKSGKVIGRITGNTQNCFSWLGLFRRL